MIILVLFSQVPFTEVLDLVRGRKVFLSRGFAYVPKDDMISILITHYRAHLSQQLAVGYVYLFLTLVLTNFVSKIKCFSVHVVFIKYFWHDIMSNVLFIELHVIKKCVVQCICKINGHRKLVCFKTKTHGFKIVHSLLPVISNHKRFIRRVY